MGASLSKMNARDKRTLRLIDVELNRYAWLFNLNYAGLVPLYRQKPAKNLYGICHPDGRIGIRVRWDNGRALEAYAIVDTMAHELAHLRFNAHSPRWFRLHAELLLTMANTNLFQRIKNRMRTR